MTPSFSFRRPFRFRRMDHRGNRRRGNRRDSQLPVRRHRQPLRRSHTARRVLLHQTMKIIFRSVPRKLRARKMMKMLMKMMMMPRKAWTRMRKLLGPMA